MLVNGPRFSIFCVLVVEMGSTENVSGQFQKRDSLVQLVCASQAQERVGEKVGRVENCDGFLNQSAQVEGEEEEEEEEEKEEVEVVVAVY